MKSNWGPEGLHQAEVLIRSALAIRPNDANANVLLGYVYVHQKRNKEAERLFEEAAANGTANLWLWANWGELLVAEGKVDQGIEKYREAITKPRSKATYDRARLDAFEKLIMLFKKQQRNSEVEKLYQQRIAEFGEDGCFNAEFARYVLDQRGDANLAAELARKEIAGRCSTPESKEVLGLANYVAWAGATEPSAQDYLNQAHVNLPMGARTLYLLATSERMIPAIRKLIATGESIEQRDNRKWNALAHALKERDYLAVPRLVRLGSRVDSVVGYDDMPVSIIPVIQDDPEGIRLMKKLGVNYGSLKFHGVSIFEQIKRSGNQKLIDAIGSGSSRT
jgi:Tfp pilus assembly protein PilF